MAEQAFKLTEKTVEAAACPAGKKDVLLFDSETRGFGLRISSKGNKTFIAQYRAAGAVRRVVLGKFGVLTVDGARRKAKVTLGAAADGRDLAAEQKAKDTAAKKAASDAAFTFGALVTQWAAAREGDRRPSYLSEAVKCCNRNLPTWRDRPAGSITVREAVRALDAIKATKGTVTANRTLAYARAAYGWAQKRQLIEVHPLRGIERPGRERSRERVLTQSELQVIWKALGGLSPLVSGYVKTLLLTLQRREEVASMQWLELAPDFSTWTLPAARAKNGRTSIVHLAEPVRAIIQAMPKIEGNPFVFAGERKGQPIRGFNSAKAQLDRLLAKTDEPPPWCFHDFRRSGVTALAGMGFAPHVCDRILNHITGSIQGVAAVYQRHEFLAERKAALDAWAVYVTRGTSATDNVIPLKGAA